MTTFDLPQELVIWNNMTPMQRWEVMQKVPYVKGESKRFKACIKYVKENIKEFMK